jgi:hypothetical protein
MRAAQKLNKKITYRDPGRNRPKTVNLLGTKAVHTLHPGPPPVTGTKQQTQDMSSNTAGTRVYN